MSLFLTLAFLFFIGSVSGWVLELFYRRFISSANPERKWINPGFCTGPYLPLYGTGLCLLYLIASLDTVFPTISRFLIFLLMAISMTVIEYIAGIWCLKKTKVRLWDYSDEWGNIEGVICPKFSLYWALIGAGYYFWVHSHILNALNWLSNNLTFSFVIGMFYGIFLLDYVQSAKLISRIKTFAIENNVVLRYDEIKMQIRSHHERTKQKYHFFHPFYSERPLSEYLKEMLTGIETIKQKMKEQ